MKARQESKGPLLAVYAALLLLLFATWALAQFDFGAFNPVVAMSISCAKMVLIVLYFMHARRSSGLTWLFVAAGLVWLLILLGLTSTDLLTRDW